MMTDLRVGLKIAVQDLKERLQFDWDGSRYAMYLALREKYRRQLRRGERGQALRTLAFLWRAIDTPQVSEFCRTELESLRRKAGVKALAREFRGLAEADADAALVPKLAATFTNPTDPLAFKHRLLELRAPQDGEKGVLVVKFTAYFTLFQMLFQDRILDDYHVVLEPSWIGFFLPEILAFEEYDHPVFVQSWEARDTEFLRGLRSNLVPVELSANSWVHPDIFHPIPGVEKEYDLAYVANWADFKRHFALFRALKQTGNPAIRLACVGANWPHDVSYVRERARYYGVEGQVDFYERVKQPELNRILARSRASIVMSRKEGANKAIVEAMFAGVPSFLRAGFNYGTQYPFLNPATGGFFEEEKLPELMERIHRGEFDRLDPRAWVQENWSPARSTRVLEEAIYGDARGRLKVKVNNPDLDFLDPSDREGLPETNERLRAYLRPERLADAAGNDSKAA